MSAAAEVGAMRRLLILALLVPCAVFAAGARAATQMPIGFFDDPSFRWSPDRQQNLVDAAAEGASVVHTTATWASIAPTRPANATNGDDPAYRLDDLDELVGNATKDGIRVMINITGTPKWANGNATPNHMPKHLADLQAFARMLATRYNGRTGHGAVSLYSVWNEPNLGLFLEPQFSGKKIVGPANYAKLYKAAYAGIKAGNPLARVAIGETSARGRDKPLKGVSDSIAPGTFAQLLAKVKGLKFDAWAHHPYPTAPNLPPMQRVKFPNVTLSTLPTFEKDLKKWFHRTVPVWITEYGHETKPGEPRGVSNAVQAKYARQALTIARKDPNVQMFIWFTFRDSAGNPWQSGLMAPSGAEKAAYTPFGALARLIDGETVNVKAGIVPAVKVFFPTLFFYQGTGGTAGMTWRVFDHVTGVAVGQPVVPFAADGSLTIPLVGFTPVKGHTYTLTVEANEATGHVEDETATLVGT
jgi:hypothetical protein